MNRVRNKQPARNGTRRRAALVMTFSFSRRSHVEFVFDQDVATWLRCHRLECLRKPPAIWVITPH